ncbi:mediator of DNA damage checkpoint protein 1 [Scophthalmus maximus]|uniref:mediator of DNA damage checkpoint protein 1 n=1 Tax=Scophthalmus maximus TaxID=52904 RepID=UPI001FA8EF42|nr:mediator of DNA damage checkpoint protein 1 [Scophthalmus maximus]
MDATQMISDSILESNEEEKEEEPEDKRDRPLAKLCILKNEHVPETELPLFLGDNVLGRDPNTCPLLLPAPSISKQHASICISVYRTRGGHSEVEALVWDLGSMNGTCKGRLKLTPNVRYALSDGDSLAVADIPCRYVNCTRDTISMRGGTRTPVSRNVGLMAGTPDASGKKGGDNITDGKKCVNGGTTGKVSLTKTPVKTSCLSFEQTPTQPQGTLVPESDSDSDGERGRGGDRRHKALVSDSDSHKSSPTCSTFLSPTYKIVPESEDESPITPSSFAKNRPSRHVSFSKEETEVDVAGQLLEEKKTHALEDDSEEEEGMEKESVASEGTQFKRSGQNVPVTQEKNVSLAGEYELPVSAPAVSTEVIPAFNMDSDTDAEGEEEGVASAVTLNTNQASQPPNTAEFHMDSDTDEDEDALDKDPQTVTSSDDSTKPPHVNSYIQPEGIIMDSETDVDDDDAAVSDTATKAEPMSFQSAPTADSAPLTQQKDVQLDSDTDVDEEEETECGTNKSNSKIDATPTGLDMKPTGPESAPAAPRSLHLDSDTDDEAIPAPTLSGPPEVSDEATESCTAADRGAHVRSDSDKDVEQGSPQVISVVGTMPGALESDSDADTDVDGSSQPPAGDVANLTDLGVDSDTNVEDKEADIEKAGDDQIPGLRRENTPGLLVPLLQNCSTPVQMSDREVENMDTQAFLSPSSVPFRCAGAPSVAPGALSSCSDSQEDEHFVVAETQSFILQTRDGQSSDHASEFTQAFGHEPSGHENDGQSSRAGSFQLGLPESSHLRSQAQALAMESTQTFAPLEMSVNMEDTQAFAATLTADRTSAENDSNLEATQAYGEEEEEPARCSVDLALEATQAYISKPYSDSEEKTDEDERKNITAAAETQPFGFPTSCTLAMAETQPISTFEEEESFATDRHRVKSVTHNETDKTEEHGQTAQPQQSPSGQVVSIAETQPMATSDNEDSDDEDSFPVPQKRKARPLQLQEEQTQSRIRSDFSIVETQPMATSENEDRDNGDSTPGLRKRRAKPPRLEEEEKQTLTNSDLSAVGTQPMGACEGEQRDDDDSFPGQRRRKAKQLRLEEEETQTLTNSELSAVGTQPMGACEGEQSDDDDSFPGPGRRKAKQLRLEEEETQTLTNSELSAVGTQPMGACEGEQRDDDDSYPGQRRRKAKQLRLEEEETQTLTNSELSAVGTQPMDTGEDGDSDEEDSIPVSRERRAKPLQLEETQPVSIGAFEGEQSDGDDLISGPRNGKAKALQLEDEETQPLTILEDSAVESQPLKTQTGVRPERRRGTLSEAGTSGVSVRKTRGGTRASIREEEEQAECSEPPKRQTRGGSKALPTTRGRRGKSKPNEDESEEEEEVELAQKAKGKRSTRQQKDNEKEGEKCEPQRNNHTENSKKKEEQERLQAEDTERIRLEQERAEKARQQKEEIERSVQKHNEQLEKKIKENEEKRSLAHEKAEREEREKLEREEKEKLEKERKEQEEKERFEREKAEREEREKLEREEKEKLEKEQEEKERFEREKAKQEEREKLEREEKEKLEKERKEQEGKERFEREKAKREEREKLEREEKERKEHEEKERLETEKRELEEKLKRKEEEHRARLQREANEKGEGERLEKEKEKQLKEQQENQEELNKAKVPSRGRRAKGITANRLCTTEQESTIVTNDDVPARRTRSRSNSSNSISSERSASSVSVSVVEGRGRGRGRGKGAKRTSEPPQAAGVRSSTRRKTVAAGTTEQDDTSPHGVLSRSLNSDISSCSVSSQNRGRGGRQRGRPWITQPDSSSAVNSQSGKNSAPNPAARGRKSRKTEGPSSAVAQEDEEEETDSQQARTTRGQRRATASLSESTAADEDNQSNQEEGRASEGSRLSQRSVRGRAQTSVALAVSDGGEAQDKRKGRKRELEANTEEDSSSNTNISKVKEKGQTMEEEGKDETKDDSPVQAKRRGRASSAQAKKNAKGSRLAVEMKEESEKIEIAEKRGRGRPSVVQQNRREEQGDSGTSANSMKQEAKVETPEPRTPASSASRKRQAPAAASPVAKSPRSSSSSPAARGRPRAASQAHKVLFTGMVDEAGERVLARLGGSMAQDVADMNCLVTDKVRRTVKFLCAVAKGIPIVTTHWLEKSGKAGSFLSPNAFIVKDPEQEKKFSFSLQASLRIASNQPLLQGYEIHVTKSVRPEPVHMKDIISCSGATFLPKMPSSHKPQTVVVSCEEDWSLCGPAVAASLPVVTAEFLLTGILQQNVDFEAHTLSAPVTTPQHAVGRGRGRKRT